MKLRLILFLIILNCYTGVVAQFNNLPDSPIAEDIKKNDIRAWKIDSRYGVADTVCVDTLITSYQDNHPVNNYSIANSWNGNLGSPLESKLFFMRHIKSFNMFASAYNPYTITPSDVVYYRTNTPFSNLVYRTALPTYREEDFFKLMLTMNASKNLNVGGLCNLIYGRGQYQYQSSRMVNGGFWSAYNGKHYEFNASVFFNTFKNRENGGVGNMDYILNPKAIIGSNSILANNIPVNLSNAQSSFRNFNYFYNHRYKIGRDIERKLDNDSVITEFQPIISIIHTFNAEDIRRRYTETNINKDFYAKNHFADNYTDDSTACWSIKNTLAVNLEEKFNRWLRFGLSAFVEYDVRHYGVAFDSVILENSYMHNLRLGAMLFKNEGKYIKYNFKGQVYLVGPYIGDFDVSGNIVSDFNIVNEPIRIEAGASFANISQYHLYENYHSNHFVWENGKLNKSLNLDINGRIQLPKRDISLGIDFRNITNYTYFNKQCLPTQYSPSLQVLAVDLTANLKAWKFHLDTKAIYQLSSNRAVLPLPDLALYSNLYYKDVFFKDVLTLQLGVSVRFHTSYYANAYMPAIGQFYLQDMMKIGNYPEMNVYANFHLKTMRFFVQYYHWNKGLFGGNNSFSMPYYPINPATFQFGLSWIFWN